MPFDIHVNFPGAEQILKNHGLQPGGPVQRFFASEVMRRSDKYVPFASGILKDSARLDESGEAIIYSSPYARYHWYGKLMVDPKTGKGAFHDPVSGRFWSRPGVQKVLTDKDMHYSGAPLRGPHWVERMWIDEGEAVCRSTEAFISRGG